MADKIVQIDGVGNVAFPDTMSDSDIGSVIQKQYHPQAPPAPAKPSLVASLWDSARHLFAPTMDSPDDQKFAQMQAQMQAAQAAKHPAFTHAADVVQKAAETPLTSYLPQGVRNRVQETANRLDTFQNYPTATKVLKGVDAAGGKVAEGLTTPSNLAVLGAMALPGVAESALGQGANDAFKAQAAVGTAQGGAGTVQAYRQGDVQGTAENATNTLVNALMYGAAAKHGESPKTPAEAAPELPPNSAPYKQTPPPGPEGPLTPLDQMPTHQGDLFAPEEPLGETQTKSRSAPIQGQFFPDQHTAPTAPDVTPTPVDHLSLRPDQLHLPFHPGQMGLFDQYGDVSQGSGSSWDAFNRPLPRPDQPTPEQLDLNPAQGNLFGNPPTAPTAPPTIQERLNAQGGLVPMQGRLFNQAGEPTSLTEQDTPATDRAGFPVITKAPDVFRQLAAGLPEPTTPQGEASLPEAPRSEGTIKAPTSEALPVQAEAPAPAEAPKPTAAESSAPVADTFKQPETGQSERDKALISQGLHKTVQDETGPPVEETEVKGPDPATEHAGKIRDLVGKVLNLTRLVKGNQVHTAIDRAILETNQLKAHLSDDPDDPNYDPGGANVGPGLSKEDQALLSHMLGERVGSVLTDDQLEKAYALKGKEMGTKPVLQYRNTASKAKVNAARLEIAKAAAATTDPVERQKLLGALEPDENGNNRPYLYEPVRENVANKPVDAGHPEAPFKTLQYGAAAPKISLNNLKEALPGEPVRSVHLDLGDPAIKAQLDAQSPDVSTEGEQEVLNDLDSFRIGGSAPRGDLEGEARILNAEYAESGSRNKLEQLASRLRDSVAAYKNTTNGADPLINQLKGLPPETLNLLPKEVRDLAQPPKTKAPESMDSPAASKGTETSKTNVASRSTETPTVAKSGKVVEKFYDQIAKQYPEKIAKVQKLISRAAEHFEDDTEGAVHAMAEAIRVYKNELDVGNAWAYKQALTSILSRTPKEPGEGTTLNSGLNPAPAIKAAKQIANQIRPRVTSEDLTLSSEDAMANTLKRYENMNPTQRSAYARSIHDDKMDRMAKEGDPDGKLGFRERLATLRESAPRDTLNATFKHWLMNKITGEVTPEMAQAQSARNLIRSENGSLAASTASLRSKLEDANSKVTLWSNYDKRDFMHKMELGLDQGDPFKNQLAGMLRESLDQARNRMTAANGVFQHYLENYFPHIFDNVGAVKEMVSQTRGISGDESFLKNRELDTINEATRRGYTQKTDNPILNTLMRIEQMDRYTMKQNILKQMKESGMAQLVGHNEPVPAGLEDLNDKAFQGGSAGRYMAPKEAAKIVNAFTSKGLKGSRLAGMPIYDAFRSVSNIQNGFQLSWSALHGFFGGVNSYLTESARGSALMANAVLRGDVGSGDISKGLKVMANAPRIIKTVKLGNDLISMVKDPSKFQDLAALQDHLENTGLTANDMRNAFTRSGMRIKSDVYGTTFADKFHDSMAKARDDAFSNVDRGKAAMGAMVNGAMRIVNLPTGLIMDHFIPALKAGHFAMQAADILQKSEGKSWDDVTSQLNRVADNMDDRFGQLVYDNMFIHQAAKDVMHVTMRSPGWNIGTARAGVGGIGDAVAAVRDAVTKKQKFQISDRTAYLGSMVAHTMLINGMVNLMMTGQMPHGADYFFARTGSLDSNGQPNRIMPKMYLYDMINFAAHPGQTTLHKMLPTIATMSDLWTNKTFYGREVYDPSASLGSRLAQMAQYVASENLPFSYTNYKEAQARGENGVMSVLGSVTGVNPAPKWVGRTKAENMAQAMFSEGQRSGGIAQDDFDRKQEYQATIAQVRNGNMSKEELRDQIKSGKVPSKILDHIYDHSKPMVVRWTGQLSPEQAMHVFQAGNAQERRELTPIMLKQAMKLPDVAGRQNYFDSVKRGLGEGPASNYHPSTHVFSPAQYQQANPFADVHAATAQAQAQGYQIHAH